MESTKRALKYQYKESKISILKFWAVVLILNAIFYFVNMRYGDQTRLGMSFETSISDGVSIIGSSGASHVEHVEDISYQLSVAGTNLAIIFIYIIASSYENFYKSFPISIGFSATRGDFFKAFLARSTLVALIFAIIQGILQKIDPILINLAGKEAIYEFLIFNTKTDSIFFIIFSIFMWLVFLLAFISLIAGLNYKFGYMFWVGFVSVFLLASFSNKLGVLGDIFSFLFGFLSMRLYWSSFINMGLFILVSYGLLYLVTIKTDVKDKTLSL